MSKVNTWNSLLNYTAKVPIIVPHEAKLATVWLNQQMK